MVITISDNGMGISQDAMPKIFEPFYTTKRVGEGTGLGLWVSYGIVKSFHGNIQVSSTEGEGTTFTITLPLESIIEYSLTFVFGIMILMLLFRPKGLFGREVWRP